MIHNNNDLPYNLRITGNEPIVEIKETGGIVNLLKLTKQSAGALAECLWRWVGLPVNASSQPVENEPKPQENSSSSLEPESVSDSRGGYPM